MTEQGAGRTSPPFCDGTGGPDGDHCCYVKGEVCTFLTVDDPRDTRPNAKFSCGILLDIRENFSRLPVDKLWPKVHRHPLFQERVQSVWDRFGVVTCGDWVGVVNEDGTVTGQCCFDGFVFDLDGNVISGPI